MMLITFVVGYGLQALVYEKRTVKREFCVPSIGYVIEADFKNRAKSFGVTRFLLYHSAPARSSMIVRCFLEKICMV